MGTIKEVKDIDGRTIYNIESINVKYAYKVEVLRWIETGKFKYDDTLDDKVLPQHSKQY